MPTDRRTDIGVHNVFCMCYQGHSGFRCGALEVSKLHPHQSTTIPRCARYPILQTYICKSTKNVCSHSNCCLVSLIISYNHNKSDGLAMAFSLSSILTMSGERPSGPLVQYRRRHLIPLLSLG